MRPVRSVVSLTTLCICCKGSGGATGSRQRDHRLAGGAAFGAETALRMIEHGLVHALGCQTPGCQLHVCAPDPHETARGCDLAVRHLTGNCSNWSSVC